MLLKPCSAGEGAVNLALSQESCGRPSGHGPGATVTLVLALVPGTFLSWSNPLTVCFFSILYTFWSLHKCWGAVGCSLCSSVDWLGVLPRCGGKWTQLPPISLPSSQKPEIKNMFFLQIYLIYLFLERGERREKERERNINVWFPLSCAAYWGPGPLPRHVPWLGIETVTLWFSDQHSIHWATPARVRSYIKLNINEIQWTKINEDLAKVIRSYCLSTMSKAMSVS